MICGAILIGIVLVVLFVFNHEIIIKVIGALTVTGLSITAIKKTTKALDDKIANEKIRKVRHKDEVKNNTASDNYDFGVNFIKRRRDKNSKRK